MKKLTLLGSTGSIGESTLQVCSHLKEEISVVALAAKSNIDKLHEQITLFHPKIVVVYDKEKALELQKRAPGCKVVGGMEGLLEVVSLPEVNFVLPAMSGTLGLEPTLQAVLFKKTIGLANKEILVSAGELFMQQVKKHEVTLLPIDSEHSALFQCLEGEDPKSIRRLLITASGGPFRTFSLEEMQNISPESALKHPTWQMGKKITIDSSTLFNKGLEVIEARWLFDIDPEQIEVVVHPQSIIHSMIEFQDSSIKAQMGTPSMITPIQYALTYPKRMPSLLPFFDFTKASRLDFFPPDMQKFPCLRLALEALKKGGSYCCFLNAANEILVNRFLNKEITWYSVGQKLEQLLEKHTPQYNLSLEGILTVDAEARRKAQVV